MLTSIPTSLSSSISPSCHLKYICIGQRIKSFEANFPEMVSFSCKVEQFLFYCAQHWQNATTRLRRRKSIHVLQTIKRERSLNNSTLKNIKRERTLNSSTLKNKATSSTTHDIFILCFLLKHPMVFVCQGLPVLCPSFLNISTLSSKHQKQWSCRWQLLNIFSKSSMSMFLSAITYSRCFFKIFKPNVFFQANPKPPISCTLPLVNAMRRHDWPWAW